MKPLAKNIGEVIYSRRYFNPSELKVSRRETCDIFHDGKIILKLYEDDSRKPSKKDIFKLDAKDIEKLYDSIVDCMQNATDAYSFIDDCDATLKLCFQGGAMILPRGLGTEENCIGWIMDRFISSLPGITK